ncbi:MAG: alginate export family protein [Alphaproteobacteria bacterium]|nr:alginate export family protein [Alphaproteobacteria bacterium]
MPLRPDHPDWYASIGAEVRLSDESIGNDNWGEFPYENSYFLQRYMLITDFHFGSRLRAFVELESDTENGRIGGPRPIDDAWLDYLGLYVEGRFGPFADSPSLLVGREELNLGSGRLVAPREGPNVRQSFTGLRARGDLGAFHFDAIGVHPNLDAPQPFAAVATQATSLWGLYASTTPTLTRPELDAYYLGIQRSEYTIARGTGPEDRHTFGVRLTRPFALDRSGLDYDDEIMYQIGTFAAHPILAWAASTATGWHSGPAPASPRLLLKADVVSGDDPKRNVVGTFDPYFPSGNYFGIFATTGPGFVNCVDLHPSVTSVLGRVTITGDWLWYWRQNVNDGVYAIPGTLLLREPSGSSARFVGERPGIEAKWQIDEHLYLQGDYGIFTAGPFIHESGPALPILYRLLWLGYKF